MHFVVRGGIWWENLDRNRTMFLKRGIKKHVYMKGAKKRHRFRKSMGLGVVGASGVTHPAPCAENVLLCGDRRSTHLAGMRVDAEIRQHSVPRAGGILERHPPKLHSARPGPFPRNHVVLRRYSEQKRRSIGSGTVYKHPPHPEKNLIDEKSPHLVV